LYLRYGEKTSAAEFASAIRRSGKCTAAGFLPAIAEEQYPHREFLPLAGSHSAAEIVPPYLRYKSRCGN